MCSLQEEEFIFIEYTLLKQDRIVDDDFVLRGLFYFMFIISYTRLLANSAFRKCSLPNFIQLL